MPATTKPTSPQFQICAALLAHGDMPREKLFKKVKIDDTKSFSNAIVNARLVGRIETLEDKSLHLTDVGKEWVSGGANLDNQRRATHSPAKVVTGKRTHKAKDLPQSEQKRVGVVAVRNGKPVDAAAAPTSFRCAVYSDGVFFLEKGGQRIELEADEHAWMLRYLERMAEQEAA